MIHFKPRPRPTPIEVQRGEQLSVTMIVGESSLPDLNEERLKFSREVKELSAHIASLERTWNRIEGGAEKDRLAKEIKMRQHQALFYIDKIENL